jgi:lysine 2,3-aminomutase
MLSQPRDWKTIKLWAGATEAQWDDWKWQFKNRITSPDQLAQAFTLTEEERRAAADSAGLFRLGITPHYATLIDPDDPDCPMRLQAVPKPGELAVADFEMADPLHEDVDSPVPGITHRYPDRVLFLITHECALFCRYCTRRRIVGDAQGTATTLIDGAIEYVRRSPQVRDVLVSGGDPLGVSDTRLEYVISRLRGIEHVEVIRIGTRMPVVMPQRITREFVEMLRRYHPVWVNTHFNHPFELQHPAARAAMERLIDAGIPTGNQTVLLKGINDCPVVMRKLSHELVKARCRPYYLYNCDLSEGLSHFRTTVAKGLSIMESLYGHTSGFSIPTFVIDAPGGGGKIPLMPNYLVGQEGRRVTLRNYEGRVLDYYEGTPDDHRPGGTCAVCKTDHSSLDAGGAPRSHT